MKNEMHPPLSFVEPLILTREGKDCIVHVSEQLVCHLRPDVRRQVLHAPAGVRLQEVHFAAEQPIARHRLEPAPKWQYEDVNSSLCPGELDAVTLMVKGRVPSCVRLNGTVR